MIIEITKDRKAKVYKSLIYNKYVDWFLRHPEQWFKSQDLELYLQTTSTRRYINRMRCAGYPIISDRKYGYKLTNNKDEIKKCYAELRERALKALTACKKMKKYL